MRQPKIFGTLKRSPKLALFIGGALLLPTLPLIVLIFSQQRGDKSVTLSQYVSAQALPTVSPTYYCGGSQNCVPSGSPTPTIYGGTGNTPTLPIPSQLPATPTIAPCGTSGVVNVQSHSRHGYNGRGNSSNGLLGQLLQFIINLINLILQLIGGNGNLIPNPFPTPTPVLSTMPQPSTPLPGGSHVPTTNPCLTVTPTPQGTIPSATPSLTIVPTPIPIVTSQPSPSPITASIDKFGIAKLYPTVSGGREWFSTWDNGQARSWNDTQDDPDDPEFNTQNKGTGSWKVDGTGILKISGSAPRMYITDDAQVKNWHNVEVTLYGYRVSDDNTPWGGLEAVTRTNHFVDTNLCDTRGIDARMRYDGHIDFEKETSHPNSVAVSNKVNPGGFPKMSGSDIN